MQVSKLYRDQWELRYAGYISSSITSENYLYSYQRTNSMKQTKILRFRPHPCSFPPTPCHYFSRQILSRFSLRHGRISCSACRIAPLAKYIHMLSKACSRTPPQYMEICMSTSYPRYRMHTRRDAFKYLKRVLRSVAAHLYCTYGQNTRTSSRQL